MRIPVPLAWAILGLSFFTSGLLRQQNDHTPASPFLTPIVGSLLFAGIFLLLLVAAREWQRGAVPGHGIRLGSLTPILLMLLLEKWVSLTLYAPLFHFFSNGGDSPALHDAQYRGFAGVSLLLVCLLIGRFSIPTARKAWRRARPSRWPVAAAHLLLIVGTTYLLIGGLAWMLGGALVLRWPRVQSLLLWVLAGQALLAFAEEVYYRGLLLSEMERLAPRLGARGPVARRWIAILTTSLLFGMEHVRLGGAGATRHLVFTVALGMLFGLLVTLSANLHLVGGLHAWVNWLLLGAAPCFVDATGQPALPAGTYIGLTLIVAFVSLYLLNRPPRGRQPARAGRGYALR